LEFVLFKACPIPRSRFFRAGLLLGMDRAGGKESELIAGPPQSQDLRQIPIGQEIFLFGRRNETGLKARRVFMASILAQCEARLISSSFRSEI